MKESNTLIELLITLLQVSFIILSFMKMNIIIAFLSCILLFGGYYIFIKYVMKLESVKSNDKLFLSEEYLNKMYIIPSFEFENFNSEKIKERLEVAFKRLSKLRQKLVYSFFNFYWKESNLNFEDLIKSRIFINNPLDRTEFKSFIKSKAEENMDIYQTPIEFYLTPISKTSNGFLTVKVDHSFSDGLGLLSLIASLSDNYSEDIFPSIMKNRSYGIKDKLIDFILFLFFGVLVIGYKIIFTKSTLKWSDNSRSDKVNFTDPVKFNINHIKTLCKKIDYSVNDLMLAVLFTAIKKVKVQNKEVTISVPYGLTPIPKSLEDVDVSNHVSFVITSLYLLDDPIKDVEIYKKNAKKLRIQSYLVRILNWGIYLFSIILPFNIFFSLANGVAKEIDICCSNLPGTTKPIEINGQKLVDVNPYVSTGHIKAFFLIVSYNECISLRGIEDPVLDIQIEQIIREFDNTLTSILKENIDGVATP